MSENLPQPLLSHHQAIHEAEFQPYSDRFQIVSTFGQPPLEYAAIRKSAALMDLPQRGLIELTGADRLAFLNNLLTNQTWDKSAKTGLPAQTGVYAFFLNNKGRIVADMNVLELGERTLLELDVRMIDTVRTSLDRYLFSEKVTLSSRVGAFYRLALHGPHAAEVLAEAARTPVGELSSLQPLGSASLNLFGADSTVFREDPCGVPGYQLIVPLDQVTRVWMSLLECFGGAGDKPATPDSPHAPDQASAALPPPRRRLRSVGWAAFNACRIEAGWPLFDIDFGNSANVEQSVVPAETGRLFARAVSLTKGCYLGQEIVARMHARQQLARQLVGLRMDGEMLPIAGATIHDAEQAPVGFVTSSTVSPVLSNAAIAMGYVKRPLFTPGMRLQIPAEGAMQPATVVELPFLPA